MALLESYVKEKYEYPEVKWVGNHLLGRCKHSGHWEPITNKKHGAEILLREAISQIALR